MFLEEGHFLLHPPSIQFIDHISFITMNVFSLRSLKIVDVFFFTFWVGNACQSPIKFQNVCMKIYCIFQFSITACFICVCPFQKEILTIWNINICVESALSKICDRQKLELSCYALGWVNLIQIFFTYYK